MIDKLAGLPTQIRQLEKRLKEMDASKVKPALVKEITDTIKNLKDMLKEKQDKREQRKKVKEEKAQEVEAAPAAPAPAMGAVAPNAVAPDQQGQPEATPTTPNNPKVSCPLCGGVSFPDQVAYQQHMQFTHASDIMPTTPGQKLDNTVAAVDPLVNKVETDPKIAPGVIVPDSVKKHDEVVDRVEQDPKIAPHIISDQEPQFKLDDTVMPARGNESKGKVMRWDGKPNDLVYIMWESGPLQERDGFGGYYPHDLKADAPVEAPVEAAMPVEEPVCQKCSDMQAKHGDLKTNYEALLKDLQEERDIHYTQGNQSWVARLDQKISDLKNAIAEKFGTDKTADGGLDERNPSEPQTKIHSWIEDEDMEDLHGLIENKLGWSVAGQFKDIMEGQALEEQNKNALRYIAEFLEKRKRNPGAAETAAEIRKYLANFPGAKDSVDLEAIDKANFTDGLPKEAVGGPEFIRKIEKAVSGHGYVGKEYNMMNGTFTSYSDEVGSTHEPLGIGQTKVRKRQVPKGQPGYEVKFGGADWRPIAEHEFNRYFITWQELNAKRPEKEGAAENAQELTIMDHTPPRANSGPDAGGKDSHDEFQDEWAMPAGVNLESKLSKKQQRELDQLIQQAVYGYQIPIMEMSKISQAGANAYETSGADAVIGAVKAYLDDMVRTGKATKTAALEPMKLNVFNRELIATPSKEGYDISHEGKKLFNIKGKENKPMSQKQLEFCAQIEFTRGMKEAKLVEKIANLTPGSRVFIMAHDKTTKRVKFASLEHGYRGWAPASKFAYLVKEGQMMQHKDHIDNTFGTNGKETLVDCPNGSGNMVWLPMGELLPINQPPATPESLNDLESVKKSDNDPCTCTEETFPCDSCGRNLDRMHQEDLKKQARAPRPGEAQCSCGHPVDEHSGRLGGKCNETGCDCKKPSKTAKEKGFAKVVRPKSGDGWQCSECGKSFKSRNEYKKHDKTHKTAALNFPPTYFARPEAKERAEMFGLIDVEDHDLTPEGLAAKQREMLEGHDIEATGPEYKLTPDMICDQCEQALAIPGKGKCSDCLKEFISCHPEFRQASKKKAYNEYTNCVTCGDPKGEHRNDGFCILCNKPCAYKPPVETEGLKQALPPQILNRRTEVNAGETISECNLCHQQKPIKPMIAGGVGGANLCQECITTLEREQAEADNEKLSSVDTNATSNSFIHGKLLKEFERKYPQYNGWTFDYMYPGSFRFYKDGSNDVFFTPDFNEDNEVDIQITTPDGAECVDGESIAYQEPLTADKLFAIVKPWLDKQEGSVKQALHADPSDYENDDEEGTGIEPGDLVDFGAYGKLYVVSLNGRASRVTDMAEERFNPHAPGWYYNVIGNEPILEKGSSVCSRCGEAADDVEQYNEGQLCDDCHDTSLEDKPLDNKLVSEQKGPCPICGDDADGSDAHILSKHPEYSVERDATNPKRFRIKHKASLNKYARVVHQDDGWHVLSEKGKNLGGPYKSKAQAVKRLRQVEYFKHHASQRPFSIKIAAQKYDGPYYNDKNSNWKLYDEKSDTWSYYPTKERAEEAKNKGNKKKADIMTDPYESLTTHITDMRSRMTQVQEKIQNVPAVKTAGEDSTKLDLPALFEDITHGVALLEDKLGGDTKADPNIHAMVEELENKLWKLEEECGITPKLSEHEKAEPEHKEIVEDLEKEAAGETMATKCQCMHLYKDHMDNDECSFESCDCKKFKKTASLKKHAMQPSKEDYIGYLKETFIPDLEESGNDATADDFKEIVMHLEDGTVDEQLVQWLLTTLIPDLVDSGKNFTAEDLLEGIYWMTGKQHPMPESENYDADGFAKNPNTMGPESALKEADVVTDQTVADPNVIKNVQPTDDDNLAVPVVAPTSPPPPGQKWVFDTQFNKYVAMPDPAAGGSTI